MSDLEQYSRVNDVIIGGPRIVHLSSAAAGHEVASSVLSNRQVSVVKGEGICDDGSDMEARQTLPAGVQERHQQQ